MEDYNSMEEDVKEYRTNLKWAQSLTKGQINFLCDGGWYNDTIRGYLILAARNAGYNKNQTNELLTSLRYMLETENKETADITWNNYSNG